MTDHLPTRLTDDVVSGLPLSVARQELLEEIMSTPSSTPSNRLRARHVVPEAGRLPWPRRLRSPSSSPFLSWPRGTTTQGTRPASNS